MVQQVQGRAPLQDFHFTSEIDYAEIEKRMLAQAHDYLRVYPTPKGSVNSPMQPLNAEAIALVQEILNRKAEKPVPVIQSAQMTPWFANNHKHRFEVIVIAGPAGGCYRHRIRGTIGFSVNRWVTAMSKAILHHLKNGQHVKTQLPSREGTWV